MFWTMPSTRFLTALAAVCVVATTLFTGQRIAAQTPAGTPSYPRTVGYIPMRDGVRLAYTVYLPAETGRFPTVLQYEPYVGAGNGPNNRWLENGYAVAYANVRGSGCSQGVLDLLGPEEGPDGAAIVSWIGAQPWSTGSVGMIGASYPGHTQILVAAEHPPALKAIAPSAITASLYDEAFYPGGIPNVTFVSRWALLLQPRAEGNGLRARIGWGDTECQTNAAQHPPSTLVPMTQSRPLFDDWWEQRSLETHVDRVRVPTYVSGSWQDHQTTVSGGVTIYNRLRDVPKRMSLSPGGHGAAYGQPAFQDDVVRWMDRWVKGVPNGIENEPPVTVYWELGGRGGRAPSWTSQYPAWPPPAVRPRTWYLTGDGSLSETAPVEDRGDAAQPRSYTFPSGTELVGSNAQFALQPEPTGSLMWTSAALSNDITVLGSVEATLFLSSENVDTDLFVALHDVYPNGDVQYLQRGFLRASMRRVDEARSRPDRLWHPFDRKELLTPGQVYEMRLTLPELGAVLRAGHKLQLALLAPSPIPQPDWGLLPLALSGRNTVHSSTTYPSKIQVPVIPGAGAQGPEPACGSMAYLPCRPVTQR